MDVDPNQQYANLKTIYYAIPQYSILNKTAERQNLGKNKATFKIFMQIFTSNDSKTNVIIRLSRYTASIHQQSRQIAEK